MENIDDICNTCKDTQRWPNLNEWQQLYTDSKKQLIPYTDICKRCNQGYGQVLGKPKGSCETCDDISIRFDFEGLDHEAGLQHCGTLGEEQASCNNTLCPLGTIKRPGSETCGEFGCQEYCCITPLPFSQEEYNDQNKGDIFDNTFHQHKRNTPNIYLCDPGEKILENKLDGKLPVDEYCQQCPLEKFSSSYNSQKCDTHDCTLMSYTCGCTNDADVLSIVDACEAKTQGHCPVNKRCGQGLMPDQWRWESDICPEMIPTAKSRYIPILGLKRERCDDGSCQDKEPFPTDLKTSSSEQYFEVNPSLCAGPDEMNEWDWKNNREKYVWKWGGDDRGLDSESMRAQQALNWSGFGEVGGWFDSERADGWRMHHPERAINTSRQAFHWISACNDIYETEFEMDGDTKTCKQFVCPEESRAIMGCDDEETALMWKAALPTDYKTAGMGYGEK